MSAKHKPEGTADKAVETTNGNNGHRSVTSKPSNFGQFGYTLTVDLTPEQVEDILQEGILHIAQRAPASRVEATLEGYVKRPAKGTWTRDQIAYSDEKARQFEVEMAKEFEAATKQVDKATSQKTAGIKATVTAYHYKVTAQHAPAYAEAKKLVKLAIQMGGGALERLAGNANYTGENLTLDNVEFLKAIDGERTASMLRAPKTA